MAKAVEIWDPPEIEYLDGRPYSKVSPKRTHALVQVAVVEALKAAAGASAQVGTEWRFKVGRADGTKTEFVPDVALVTLERLRPLSTDDREEPPFAPDVAVEVRSPSYRPGYSKKKIERYLKTGTILVLDVDPARRQVIAHAANGQRNYGEADRFEHKVVPWLAFDVASLFRDLDLL